ncbi:metal-dependent hydrolase [Haloglomus litoreum]|uniref:metal-dependent hydrolase n=1 Tax=Haloglomus litoreum TaxID=3034026 RepID=UPI0023E87D68|nr:metal-dependent hydrolase [Haloglomus sp. DT116]
MMATTHVLVAAGVASLTALVAPEHAPTAAAAAGLGGLVPDLDIYAGHRRTLHFPVYAAGTALLALVLAVMAPSMATVAAAAFLGGAALHATMDAFGGGLELRPWEAGSERAVYSHYHGRWLAPRRWVRYDGAPEDLLVATVAAVPTVLLVDGTLPVVGGVLAVSTAYVALRRRLAALWARLADHLVPRLPPDLQDHVPERFVEAD